MRARLVPSKPGADPAQLDQAPPWIHTITGFLALFFAAGVKMLSDRQCSPIASIVPYQALIALGAAAGCGAEWPKATVSRIPAQGFVGTGGRKRLAPADE